MYFNDLLKLVLVYKDIEPRNGGTRTKGFFSTVRVVSLTTCMLSINFLKHFKVAIFKKICFRESDSGSSLVQLEHIRKHV